MPLVMQSPIVRHLMELLVTVGTGTVWIQSEALTRQTNSTNVVPYPHAPLPPLTSLGVEPLLDAWCDTMELCYHWLGAFLKSFLAKHKKSVSLGLLHQPRWLPAYFSK